MLRGKHGCLARANSVLVEVLILIVIQSAQGKVFTVNVGIAVGNTGRCSEMEDAHRGHKLFADKLNDAQALSIVDSKGEKHHLLFNYTRYIDDCEQEKHDDLVKKLIFEDKVHFMLGSTPLFAESESIIANDAKKLMYHCCVGPDSLYEKDMKYIFGIPASNMRYPLKALKSMVLSGGVQRLYIFSLDDNIFTSSTCNSAAEYSSSILKQLSPDMTVIKMRRYTSSDSSADPSFYENIVADAIDLQADALLGCDFEGPGIAVTQALAARNYYLKALWLTVAPAHANFVPTLGTDANYALSAGQWHPDMTFADEFFGTATQYTDDFQQAFGLSPSYVAAQASATSYSLAVAIRDAFQGCTLSADPNLDMDMLLSDEDAVECVDEDGDAVVMSGYKRVRNTLARQYLKTFFGEVVFNQFRRNVAKEAATFQVLDGTLQAVLPLEFANKAIVMPRPEPVHAHDHGTPTVGNMKQDAFIALVVTVVGVVLLLCLAGILYLSVNQLGTNRQDNTRVVISVDNLRIINPPVLLWDGSWESGKAVYKNALVALEPLTEVRLAKSTSVTIDSASIAEDAVREANCPSVAGTSFYSVAQSAHSHDSDSQRHPGAITSKHHTLPADLEDPPATVQSSSSHNLSAKPSARLASGTFTAMSKLLSSFKELDPDKDRHPSVHLFPVPRCTRKEVVRLLWRYRGLQHPSVVPVIGLVWSLPSLPPNLPVLVTECQELGQLTTVQENETLVLDTVKKMDIAKDLAMGLAYLHAQEEPRLKPVLLPRLAGVQLNKHCRAKLRVPLTALRGPKRKTPAHGASRATRKLVPYQPATPEEAEEMDGEVSSQELEDVWRYGMEIANILLSVRTSGDGLPESESWRDKGSTLQPGVHQALQAEHGSELADLLLECCYLDAQKRPCFSAVHRRLEEIGHQAINNARAFHRSASKSKQPADELLYELFPVKVAEALKAGRLPDPEPFPEISLFFCDICGYTELCSQLNPAEVMDMLHRLYSRFDALAQELQLFKVETIGDSYMCASNIKHLLPSTHAAHMADFAFRCNRAANAEPVCPSRPELGCIHIRAGIHAGAVMGAVVGTLNRRFCLFGDCVNVASRMESTCYPDHVQCSEPFMQLLREQWPQAAEAAVPRGPRLVKGKGNMSTFMLFPPDG